MTDRPILFSAPMVRALLDGTKTQTRRVLKPQPPAWVRPDDKPGYSCFTPKGHIEFRGNYVDEAGVDHGPSCKCIKLPFAKGQRLWVRETWACHWATNDQPPRDIDPDIWSVRYMADDYIRPAVRDGDVADLDQCQLGRPSIFMPRWASRLTLTVTDVRVERLQNISEDDAFAEGIESDIWDMAVVARDYRQPDARFIGWGGAIPPSTSVDDDRVGRESYRTLWDSINGKGAWEANPWVVAVSFEVHQCNIDQLHQQMEAA